MCNLWYPLEKDENTKQISKSRFLARGETAATIQNIYVLLICHIFWDLASFPGHSVFDGVQKERIRGEYAGQVLIVQVTPSLHKF